MPKHIEVSLLAWSAALQAAAMQGVTEAEIVAWLAGLHWQAVSVTLQPERGTAVMKQVT